MKIKRNHWNVENRRKDIFSLRLNYSSRNMSWQCGKFSVISIYFLSFHHWFLYIFRSYFVACFVVVLVKSIVFRRNDKMKENENEPSVIVSIDEAANGDDKKGFSSEKKNTKCFKCLIVNIREPTSKREKEPKKIKSKSLFTLRLCFFLGRFYSLISIRLNIDHKVNRFIAYRRMVR